MQPRVYVYRITFEEVPNFYHGWHKEKIYDELYMGSPITCRDLWELYTPKKEILKEFDYSEEGMWEALSYEDKLIEENWLNPLALNRSRGGFMHPCLLQQMWKDQKYRTKKSEQVRSQMIDQWKDPEFRRKMAYHRQNNGHMERWRNTLETLKDNSEHWERMSILMSEMTKNRWEDPGFRERISSAAREQMLEQWKDPVFRGKRSQDSSGERNSQYGTMWVTDGTPEGNRKINQGDEVPVGFFRGRTFNSGEENPNFGKMWITDDTKEGSRMVPKDSDIPEGFRKGRVRG